MWWPWKMCLCFLIIKLKTHLSSWPHHNPHTRKSIHTWTCGYSSTTGLCSSVGALHRNNLQGCQMQSVTLFAEISSVQMTMSSVQVCRLKWSVHIYNYNHIYNQNNSFFYFFLIKFFQFYTSHLTIIFIIKNVKILPARNFAWSYEI